MSGTFLWCGLTMIVALPLVPIIGSLLSWEVFGAVVMTIGAVLLLLKK